MRKKKVHSRDFMNFSKYLSEEIRKVRMASGLTLEEVEEMSRGRIKWRHLQKIETNHSNNIQIDTLFHICRVLKIHPSELLKDLKV